MRTTHGGLCTGMPCHEMRGGVHTEVQAAWQDSGPWGLLMLPGIRRPRKSSLIQPQYFRIHFLDWVSCRSCPNVAEIGKQNSPGQTQAGSVDKAESRERPSWVGHKVAQAAQSARAERRAIRPPPRRRGSRASCLYILEIKLLQGPLGG